MRTVQKQKKIVDLYSFAHQKAAQKPIQKSHATSRYQHSKSSSSQFGLSTLLHFNANDSLSSIRSHNFGRTQRDDKEVSRFGSLMGQAKQEIQEMRLKRVEMEAEWKGKFDNKQSRKDEEKRYESIENQEESYVEQALNQSQVQEYDEGIYKSVYPKQRSCHTIIEEDRFALQLKTNILKDKLQQFKCAIRKAALIDFAKELKKYDELTDFALKRERGCKEMVFESWKQMVGQLKWKKQLRQAIVQKMKKKKQKNELDEFVENYPSTCE